MPKSAAGGVDYYARRVGARLRGGRMASRGREAGTATTASFVWRRPKSWFATRGIGNYSDGKAVALIYVVAVHNRLLLRGEDRLGRRRDPHEAYHRIMPHKRELRTIR